MKKSSRWISLFHSSKELPWVIILVGVVLRLARYLVNKSIWLDEAFLASDIVNRSFPDLLQPLNYNQYIPVGFLVVEKLAVQMFGNNEYALRLFPLLSGILSAFLFYQVIQHFTTSKSTLIALGLFAILEPLIYYSSEVKPYSTDVAVGLLLYLMAVHVEQSRLTVTRLVVLGIVGALAVWFSQPSVFILAGIGMSLALSSLVRRKYARIVRLLIVYSLWIVSLVACYFVSVRPFLLRAYEAQASLFRGRFLPFPPTSFRDINWIASFFFDFFEDPVGLSLSGVAALAFLIGCSSLFSKKRWGFLILISPMPFALLASGLQMYPFWGRLALFAVPIVLLFIAEGTAHIIDKTKNDSPVIGFTLIGLLFLPPLLSARNNLIAPPNREEIRPVMSYVAEHRQDGDLLYLYYGSIPTFRYYSDKYGFNESCYLSGIRSRDNWSDYTRDLDKLRGNKRVWILFSHVCTWSGVDEKVFFLQYLNSVGRQLDSFEALGAAVYLYDLGE